MTTDQLNVEFEQWCKERHAQWRKTHSRPRITSYVWNPRLFMLRCEEHAQEWRDTIDAESIQWWQQRGYRLTVGERYQITSL